jgi:uncharacterized cupredoxin-like copper-binding protein
MPACGRGIGLKFYCLVGNHEQAGMVGTLTVR